MKKGKKKTEAVGIALQIVFEYPDWTAEHVDEMLNCSEKRPCSGDELYELCQAADMMKRSGKTYQQVEAALLA
jgi:hypothetical protein